MEKEEKWHEKAYGSYDFDMIDYEASLRRGNNNGTLGYTLICRPKDPKNTYLLVMILSHVLRVSTN